MRNEIALQLMQAITSLAAGAVLGVLYDILKSVRRKTRALTVPADVVFCAAAAITMFLLGMWAGQGELRLFMFVFAAAGAACYALLLSGYVLAAAGALIQLLCEILNLLTKPFMMLGKLLKKFGFFIKKSFQNHKKWFTITGSKVRGKKAYSNAAYNTEDTYDENQKSGYYYQSRYSGDDIIRRDQPGGPEGENKSGAAGKARAARSGAGNVPKKRRAGVSDRT